MKTICVIGAGVSGLAAIKCCKEEGHQVQCYDRADGIGGLWRYQDIDENDRATVMKNTVINTSKELSCYSDFPPPAKFANFMHNSVMLKYFELYARHFDLTSCIKFKHSVEKVEMNEDYETTGKWKITVNSIIDNNNLQLVEVFDGIMVCTGHHCHPKVPHFSGMDKFQGKVKHSQSLKTSAGFENQRVLVIGIGNSAVDAAVEICTIAKKVYISTRHGSWISPRTLLWGVPLDVLSQRRIVYFFMGFCLRLMGNVWQFLSNIRFDHALYGLKPKHNLFSAHPTINDQIHIRIAEGKISIRKDVETFVENGVLFDGEEEITEIDSVVLATGYDIRLPFLDENCVKAMKKICVIGAGPSGLAAVKSCKEEGHNVQCYDRSDGVGGLWRYHDSDEGDRPSVMKSTTINTSKELSAYSDFPPPVEFANFMHNSYMLKYFEMYAEYFDLMPSIKFHHSVEKVEKSEDYQTTGRWKVTVSNVGGRNVQSEVVFDGVMVCTGHHCFPNIPDFPGLKTFRGRVMHTHSLKTPAGFEKQRVLVIGIGNSAVDAAVEISTVAEKVYLSTRHGSWISSRIFLWGEPVDGALQRRFWDILHKVDGFHLLDRVWEWFMNLHFDHTLYGLRPDHGILNAHPTVNDLIPSRIIDGRISVRKNVESFTQNGVFFQDQKNLTEIDAVVLATGYNIRFPFLDDNYVKVSNNDIGLYKMMVPLGLPHASLAVIGLVQPLGCIFPIAEAQCRWYSLLMSGKEKLPSKEEMEKDTQETKNTRAKRYVHSARHTIQVDYIPFMDDICSQFGAKPSLLKLAFTDPKLFYACLFGQCTAYQYRLCGPHPWSGARKAILETYDRIKGAINV